jgi:molybdate transport system ATP-binding protein
MTTREMPISSLLQVSDALCRINRQALLRVPQFSIKPGEHWCLFGRNGAGKSVLAALLAGKRVESGSYVAYRDGFEPARDILLVSFEEQQRLWQRDDRLDMSEYSDRAQDSGTLVRELLHSGLEADAEVPPETEMIIEQLALQPLLEKGIRFLSSGQIRRALIARALVAAVGKPNKLVVLDDPLESIDKDSRQRISGCIDTLRSSGFSSLLLCRRQQDILPGTTHIGLMIDLELRLQGTARDVLKDAVFQAHVNKVPRLPELLPGVNLKDASAEASEEVLIELEQVQANYGEQLVLEAVSWRMTSANHTLIEGPNGCGKSTLLSLIDGENHMAYGQHVRLFGQQRGSGESVWEVKARFGVVSNELHNKYVKGWKVLDVVVSGFYDSVGLYDDSGATEWAAARAWLACVELAEAEASYYHELSFGQQRLVLLARAMVKNPLLLVLDEPCVGLDDYHRKMILGILDLVASQTRTRLIYVSHVSEEWPACINQRLEFVPASATTHTLVQRAC